DSIEIVPDDGSGPAPATLDVGLNEAEALDLTNYAVEDNGNASGGQVVRGTGGVTNTVSGSFAGATGAYWLDVTWINENDGEASFEVLVNGETVASWGGGGGEFIFETPRIAVDLETGDTIEVVGVPDNGEFARLDKIEIVERTEPAGFNDDDFDFFAFAGQSNAELHFTRLNGDLSEGPLSFQVFETEVETLTGAETTAIEAGRGGSGSNEFSDPEKYWWNLTNDEPGPELLDSVAVIQAAIPEGKDLDGIIWSQGEDDASARYSLATTQAEKDQIIADYIEATVKTFEYYWSVFGDVPIFIQELGAFEVENGSFVDNGSSEAADALRAAQQQIVADYPLVHLGATTTQYETYDTVHYSVSDKGAIADDLANSVVDTISDEFVFV
ncbi:MAG: hypothetical protein QNJ13_17395, partial [Paracoccaceae bacterium]|nr:hypothetical protein [Paracoccaceae bacterium]